MHLMYKIDESKHKEKYDLILPSMLDGHYPLLKYMFWSRTYRPILLDNDAGIVDEGLRYINNDMCFPVILITGQMIKALKDGDFNIEKTHLLMATAGDACRGANYVPIMRRAVHKAGFNCRVLTINVAGFEKENMLPVSFQMFWRGLFGMFYADILLALLWQTRPYELEKGAADAMYKKWEERLADDLRRNKHLSIKQMKNNFKLIVRDFKSLKLSGEKKQRVGIVGEIFGKYSHLGNYDVARYLEERGCEVYINGLSWYVLYYIQSHMNSSKGVEKTVFNKAYGFIEKIQNCMIEAIRSEGFYVLDNMTKLRKQSKPYVSDNLNIGDGWLIGTEIIGMIKNDCRKVLAVAPFGCLPNCCCGRGVYHYLQRTFPEGMIVPVEPDSSASTQNYFNRESSWLNLSINDKFCK